LSPADTALVILRVWLAVVMLAHGINHGRNLDGTASWFASKGFRHARLNALGSAGGEIVIGSMLLLGLATTFAAAGVASIMTVAFGSIHRFAGFFVFHRPDEGYEYVVTLIVTALALATVGPGDYSLDALLDIDPALDGWVGFGIVLLGVAAGAAQLAISWRRPPDR
jgi:putative oxidoreductase